MARARRHREAELARLRGDPAAVEGLRAQDRRIPVPTSSGPFEAGNSEEIFIRRWYDLVNVPGGRGITGTSQDAAASVQIGGRESGASAQSSYGPSTAFDFAAGGHWVNIIDPEFGDYNGNEVDMDMDMGMGEDVNWNTWLESATLMEMSGLQGQQP